jgi:two-component sensor histidine kinase
MAGRGDHFSTSFLDGGGKMGALMRAHDWTNSPLGDPAAWPDALKMAVGTCLSSRFPMVVWWGPQLIMLYNDAWQPILGETKHPGGLGRPGAESWPETWPIVGEQFERALSGVASWSEDLLLASDRHGFMEECYFTYSHSPLKDAAGKVVGVHSVVSETTARVLSERRLRILCDLSNATVQAATETNTIEQTSEALVSLLCSKNPDVPFGLLYLIDASGRAQLMASAGVDPELFPRTIDTDGDVWGLRQVLGGFSPATIEASSAIASPLPGGVWPEPTKQLVALALAAASRNGKVLGALLLGISSRLQLDEPYLDYLRLIAAQFSGSLSTLQSIEKEKRALHAKQVLINELQHRTRNLLAIVRSISQRTRSASSSLDDYGAEFDGRLGALSRVQGLLSRDNDEIIAVGELVQMELEALAPLDHKRVTADGPSIALPREAVQLLSLALHELVTNSLKYGALKASTGTLLIQWRIVDIATKDDAVRIDWVEGGVNPLSETTSARRGFGRVLLEDALPRQLGAKTNFELRNEGLICFLQIPLMRRD